MNTNKEIEVIERFEDLFKFDTVDQELQHEATMISFRFISELEQEMDKVDMNRSELAKELGTSKSYLTQLWRGDKVVNLKFIAKCQMVFKKKFEILLKHNNNQSKTINK